MTEKRSDERMGKKHRDRLRWRRSLALGRKRWAAHRAARSRWVEARDRDCAAGNHDWTGLDLISGYAQCAWCRTEV